jgi:hypothetical protein
MNTNKYEYTIDINNNNLNLISFTINTLSIYDLKTVLLNFNHKEINSELDFLSNTSPSFLYLFNFEGKLFGHYTFLIHRPENDTAKKSFDNFVTHLRNDIIDNCSNEAMDNNIYIENYQFYMYISINNLLED